MGFSSRNNFRIHWEPFSYSSTIAPPPELPSPDLDVADLRHVQITWSGLHTRLVDSCSLWPSVFLLFVQAYLISLHHTYSWLAKSLDTHSHHLLAKVTSLPSAGNKYMWVTNKLVKQCQVNVHTPLCGVRPHWALTQSAYSSLLRFTDRCWTLS